MLLTELILSKRGPLAKVWLSAHHERKLSKQQALGVDVGESVEAILGQEDGGVTLRVSGQLMLGVTRIYSRKAQYLLDDCRETREKISRAFRPGNVDLPEDQHRASKSAITFTETENTFDIFDWSWGAPPALPDRTGITGSSSTQLNLKLRPSGKPEYGAYNFGRPHTQSLYGGSTPSRQSVEGDTSRLDSNDFSGIDLDLIPHPESDNGPGRDDFSIPDIPTPEGVRDVQTPRSRRSSVRTSIFGKDRSVDIQDEQSHAFQDIDLGLFDMGDMPLPPLEDNRSRRETSALSTPPPVSPPSITDITPRTAKRVADLATAAEARDRSLPVPGRVKKSKLAQADAELELSDAELAHNRDLSDILTEERYIPSDPEVIRLREIAADPGAYFLPTIKIGGDSMFYAGPPDLASELTHLFTFPTDVLRKRRETDEAERAAKRARIEQNQIDGADRDVGENVELISEIEVEGERRASVVPSERFDLPGGDDSFNLGDQGDIPGFDLPEDATLPQFETPRKIRAAIQATPRSVARSQFERAMTAGLEGTGEFTLAMFDPKAGELQSQSQSQSQSQNLITPTKSIISEQARKASSGFSKETVMAMGLLRRELDAIEEEDKVLQFEKVAEKATRKAASSFFFELLVLGTKDYVKLEQKKAYQDIKIEGKERLWDDILA